MRSWDFSPKGRARVVMTTVIGTVGLMAVALAAVTYTTRFMDPQAAALTFASAVIIPLLVSAPILYYFSNKLRENALMQDELARIASQDSLTTCLNRGAFITLVDAYLSQVNAPKAAHGGFLVIDADHFKTINDRFGHSAGDQALRLIVEAAKSALRKTDLLGRIGGEEFAVLLAQANAEQSKSIAERIRASVCKIEFRAKGEDVPLSVSIGAVHFGGPVSFSDLHVAADERLYEAKRKGRNRIEFQLFSSSTGRPSSA